MAFTPVCVVTLLLCVLVESVPHLLLINIDDLGYNDVSYQNAEYQTPNIDQLAASGLKLSQYYVQPSCTPTRTAMMTGRYPFRVGLQSILTNFPATHQHIPLDTPLVSEVLKQAGYTTRMIGKWHLGYSSWAYTPTLRGFDSHFGYFQAAEDYYTHQATFEGITGLDLWRNRTVVSDQSGTYSTTLFKNEAISVINNHDPNTPLFLYLATQTIHEPIQAPPADAGMTQACAQITDSLRMTYCLKMQFLDAALGEIMNAWKARGLYDNTFGIFTTDNGGMVHLPNNILPLTLSAGSNYPLRAGKLTCFEGGVRGVGVLFGGANVFPSNLQGQTSSLLFHAVDVPVTLMAAAGTGFSGFTDGIDMMTAVTSTNAGHGEIPLNIALSGLGPSAMRIGDMKMVTALQVYDGYYRPGQAVTQATPCSVYCLFNITADPLEQHDLSLSMPVVLASLVARLQSYTAPGGYVPEQSYVQDPLALPALHNGVWAPWSTF
jgi:arylsulfatase A-like enzyme